MAYQIEKFYSKKNPELLLHQAFRHGPDIPAGVVSHSHGYNIHFGKLQIPLMRVDISPEAEGLQVAYLTLEQGKTFRPHLHLVRPRMLLQTQEAWVVIQGSVGVTYCDEDGEELAYRSLGRGDMSITYAGGHNYKALEGSVVYEFKLGDFAATGDKAYLDELPDPVVQPAVKQDGPLEGSADASEASSGPGSGHDRI